VRFNDGTIMDRIPGIAPARKAFTAFPHVGPSFAVQSPRRPQPILINLLLFTRHRTPAIVASGIATPCRTASSVAGLINART